jgi:hypothetical protein
MDFLNYIILWLHNNYWMYYKLFTTGTETLMMECEAITRINKDLFIKLMHRCFVLVKSLFPHVCFNDIRQCQINKYIVLELKRCFRVYSNSISNVHVYITNIIIITCTPHNINLINKLDICSTHCDVVCVCNDLFYWLMTQIT